MDDDGTGEIVEFLAEAGLQPGLDAEGLIPRDALEEGIDEADEQEGSDQLRAELGAFGDAARNDGGTGGGEGQQDRKKNLVSSKPFFSNSVSTPEKKLMP